MFYFLALSAIIFASGLYGVLTRKTLSGMLPSIYLMLSSAAFNCIVFNSLIRTDDSAGYIFGFAIIAVGAATFVIGRKFDARPDKPGDASSVPVASQNRSIEIVSPTSEPMVSDV